MLLKDIENERQMKRKKKNNQRVARTPFVQACTNGGLLSGFMRSVAREIWIIVMICVEI
jgi:hypothetical protein